MLAPIALRLGSHADTRTVAELMLRASGGLFEQLLDDIMPGVGAEPLLALALAINQADSAFGCDNTIIAERDGTCCGMALCFPTADYRLPDAVTAIVPPSRLGRIEALIRSCPGDSFYIHSLATMAAAERSGVAHRLLLAATEMAAAQGLPTVSLHVWAGNAPAMALYRGLNFANRGPVEIPPSPRLRWSGPVLLLAADTAALLRRLEVSRRASADA